MIRPPPRSTRTDTLFPYTTLFRSDANDVAADPRHETTRLALYDPRGIMRLFETFDPPIRERHAVDPPAQYVDPEERVLSRRPQGAFAEAVAPIARNHPHIGHQ